MLQDSDWEEVGAEDVEADKDLLYSAGITSFGRPTNEHLEAMAKVFNEVFSFSCTLDRVLSLIVLLDYSSSLPYLVG